MTEEKKQGRPKASLKDRLSREEFILLHHDKGLSQKAIAAKYDISIAYVIRLRKQYDIPVNLVEKGKGVSRFINTQRFRPFSTRVWRIMSGFYMVTALNYVRPASYGLITIAETCGPTPGIQKGAPGNGRPIDYSN